MNILLVTLNFNNGGITTACVNFANELILRGHNVSILNMKGRSSITPKTLNSNVKILYLDKKRQLFNMSFENVKITKNIFKKLYYLIVGLRKKALNKKSKWIKTIFKNFKLQEDFDVAIAYRQCAPSYYFTLNCVNAEKKIGFVHGDIDFMGDISTWEPYMQHFDKIAYVSKAVQDGFIKKYPALQKNACVIYNFLDANYILELSKKENPLNFSNEVINISTISRIENEHKAIDRIPKICKKLKDLGTNNFRWYVVGNGVGEEYCKNLSKQLSVDDVLFFVGKHENPYAILKNSTFSVLPTKTESFGLVVLESLICNTPVVVSEYPAIKEIFKDEEYGFICEQSIESLTSKIKLLIENKNEYKKIKESCNKFKFSNDLAYNQFVNSLK